MTIILNLLSSIVGLALLALVVIIVAARIANFAAMFMGFFFPAVICIIGMSRVQEFLGISNGFMDTLIFGLFVCGAILSIMEIPVVSAIGSGAVCSGTALLGLLMMKILPTSFLQTIAENAASVVTVCFVPLFIIILIIVLVMG